MQIKPSSILIVSFIATISVYAYINTSGLRRGPVISVEYPVAYSTVPGVVEVRGTIKHVKEATINQKQMTFTTKGEFVENIVLTSPSDNIDIVARNAYGKTATLSLPLNVAD